MTASEEIYKLYPRHVGKKAAIRAIQKTLDRLMGELLDEQISVPGNDTVNWLKSRVRQYANSPAGNRGRYTPHPATWFQQSRYLDDEAEWFLLTTEEAANLRQYREANVGVWRPE